MRLIVDIAHDCDFATKQEWYARAGEYAALIEGTVHDAFSSGAMFLGGNPAPFVTKVEVIIP